MAAHRDGIAARRVARFVDWVNIGIPHKRDPGGSPFQTPTRLADGLGHGSDLVHGYPCPFAPSPDPRPGNLGPPHWPSGRKANLGCIYCCMINRTPGQFVKRPHLPSGAGQNSSMQTRGRSADAVETPKASFIPAQGKRPGFIALKTVSSAEGATHLSSASRATASNR
jgi:hypothetical protein